MNKKLKVFLICLTVFIIVLGAIALYIWNFFEKSKNYEEIFATPTASIELSLSTPGETEDTVKREETPAPEDIQTVIKSKDNIVNIMFLGIDRTEERDETMGVYRTDTIMFASFNLNSHKVEVLCIPRDSYVYIPVIDKKDKINHAYVWGGMKKEGIKSTIETVNNFIKYDTVDYYFAIDIEPVPDIVEAIGGVEINVEIDMKSENVDISKGHQVLDGKKAMDFIRWRNTGNGDIDRIRRQQDFLKAAVDRIKNNGKILEAVNIVLKYSKYIQTDLSPSQMLALANFSKDVTDENLKFFDTPGYGEYIDGISYWIPDEKVVEMFNKQQFMDFQQ